ncbi:MAG: single-stranded-DNA-specific exonuclease RecJ [Chlorobi bacterium]|nr:single-stranded-DNA-specific exonuclease RecJ [Chlorobiota bacterium]
MKWKFADEPDEQAVKDLEHQLGIPRKIARLLVRRGVTDYEQARKFFKPSLNDFYDPFLMRDMGKTVDRIEQALRNGERILVYGDYDVDGTTAVALLYSYLKELGAEVDYYVPDRNTEGYGISFRGVDYAARTGVSLMIALDCGIKAHEQVAYARDKGIDVVIGDHHTPGAELPPAFAILNPKRPGCPYPYKELSGAGIAFKIVQAMHARRGGTIDKIMPYLDLVAVSVAADIVPITDENRTMTYFGLAQLQAMPRPGLKVLMKSMKKNRWTVPDLVFILAPRINSAGRMDHGKRAVELLIQTDERRAEELGLALEDNNRLRRETDSHITEEALRIITDRLDPDQYTTVVYRKDWHKGVVGIVASRLIEKFYRPTVVFTYSEADNLWVGSARSVKNFDLYAVLDSLRDYIHRFGGHKFAAGLSVKPENLKPFIRAFEAKVREVIPEELRTPEIEIEEELDLGEITPRFARLLKRFAPFGPGNMKPVFMTRNLRDTGFARTVGRDHHHLRMFLTDGSSMHSMAAIAFNQADKYDLVRQGKPFAAVYQIEENEWQGRTSLQLKIKDLKPGDPLVF